MSKYYPLEQFLRATPDELDLLTLGFQQIETIIGSQLPASHTLYRQWWENQSDPTNRPQAEAWLKAGFRVEDVRLSDDGWVTFRKVR